MNNDFSRPFWILPTFADHYYPKLIAHLTGKSPPNAALDTKEAHQPYQISFSQVEGSGNKADNTILAGVISFKGTLFQEDEDCTDGMMTKSRQIEKLANDDSVQSIILVFRSPGGMVDGTATVHAAIDKAKTKKPVIGYIEDGMCASAAVSIAVHCTHIMASKPLDMVGSIGTMCQIADYSEMLEMNGIKLHEIYASKSTQKNKIYRDVLAGDYKAIKAELDLLNNQFIESVQQLRPKTKKYQELFTGAMFTATEAIEKGLIDSIGSWQDCLQTTLMEIEKFNQSKSNPPKKRQTEMKKNFVSKAFHSLTTFLGKDFYNQDDDGAMVLNEQEAQELNQKITALEKSAADWKAKAEDLQKNVVAVEAQTGVVQNERVQELEKELEAIKSQNAKLIQDNKEYRQKLLMDEGTNPTKTATDATALDGEAEQPFRPLITR